MFEALRRMIFPIIIIVLFFFVAMIVLQWGLGMSTRQNFDQANVAAVINGEEVPWQEYNRIYNNLVQSARAELEDDQELPDTRLSELRNQAWQQLLADRLLTQKANENNIVVTDEEVYSYLKMSPPQQLRTLPYFQTDGQFDYQKYINSMADPQMAGYWASLEPVIESDMRKLKMQQLVIQTANVTEQEVRQMWLRSSEKVKVGMINVGFARFSQPPPRPTEEEIKAYYEENSDKYTHPERASLNVVMLEKKPGRYDWERAHNQAKEIYDSLQAGADFGALAYDMSQDPGSARDSGSLGWFDRGRMVEEFDRIAFALEEGEISEPVRTQFGWHIIKQEGLRDTTKTVGGEEQTVKQARASHILIKAEPSRETLDGYYQTLSQFQTLAREMGFFPAAEEMTLPATPTGYFARGDDIPKVGRNEELNEFAFEKEIHSISEVMENQSGFFVAEVANKQSEGILGFEEVREQARMDLVRDLVAQKCRDTADAIWADIKAGMEPEEAAENHGDEYEVLENEWGRDSYIRGIGRSPKVIGAAFSLDEVGEMTPPVEHDQGVAILQLRERKQPDLAEYTAKRDSLKQVLLTNKQQMAFSNWFEHMIDNSEIVNNTERLATESDYY
jgi:parvulin-like peptidyl-prolyl isomerase